MHFFKLEIADIFHELDEIVIEDRALPRCQQGQDAELQRNHELGQD